MRPVPIAMESESACRFCPEINTSHVSFVSQRLSICSTNICTMSHCRWICPRRFQFGAVRTTCSLFAVDTWHLQLTVCVLGLLGTVRGVRGVRARHQWMPPAAPAERHAVQLPTPVVPVVPVGLAATRQGGRVLLGAVSPMAQVKGSAAARWWEHGEHGLRWNWRCQRQK